MLARVKQKTIVEQPSDKSGKLVISSIDGYRQQGQVHISKDIQTSWDEFMQAQRVITGALKGLNRVFKTGFNWGPNGMERTWLAKKLVTTNIPMVMLLSDDHKTPGLDGIPKTRPTCLASNGRRYCGCSQSSQGDAGGYFHGGHAGNGGPGDG